MTHTDTPLDTSLKSIQANLDEMADRHTKLTEHLDTVKKVRDKYSEDVDTASLGVETAKAMAKLNEVETYITECLDYYIETMLDDAEIWYDNINEDSATLIDTLTKIETETEEDMDTSTSNDETVAIPQIEDNLNTVEKICAALKAYSKCVREWQLDVAHDIDVEDDCFGLGTCYAMSKANRIQENLATIEELSTLFRTGAEELYKDIKRSSDKLCDDIDELVESQRNDAEAEAAKTEAMSSTPSTFKDLAEKWQAEDEATDADTDISTNDGREIAETLSLIGDISEISDCEIIAGLQQVVTALKLQQQ